MNKEIVIGSVVLSTMGRDSGRYFMVLEIVNEDYVLLVDGEYRTMEKPKLKKIKHIKPNGKRFENLAEKVLMHKQLFDIEIKKALREFSEPRGEK